MFQGMARGKVGDVVFSRLNGEQISRVRNRHPQNPRTNKQLVQRAIMATIMQMYSAGKAIFDHSFQGKSVPAGSQREFMSVNAKALRAALATDFTNATQGAACLARVVGPKSLVPVPNAYIISQGTYEQNLFDVSAQLVSGNNRPTAKIAAPTEGETINAYAQRVGLIPGDIYTIVALASSDFEAYDDSELGQFASTPRAAFGFVRLIVKSDLSATTALANFSDLFDIDASKGTSVDLSQIAITDFVTPDVVTANPDLQQGAIGVIRSREDSELRSNSTMVFVSDYGIIAPYLVARWQDATTQIGNSDLILEGGNF